MDMSFLAFDATLLAEPDMIARLVLQAFLFCLSFFFSGSETALFSLSPLDLRKLHTNGHKHADRLDALLERPRQLIISLLCGNELVNIAATANMAGILVTLYGAERAGVVNLIVMFPLLLLLGEITPKTISVSAPVRISTTFVAGPLTLWVRVVTPLREAVRVVADYVTTAVVGSEVSQSNILNRDEFRTIIDSIHEDAVLSTTERVILDKLLECVDVEVVEIMTPRTRIDFVNADRPLDWAIDKFLQKRHTRMPVWRRHRDNVIGVLHVDDVAELVMSGTDLNTITIDDILREPVVVPLTKTVDEVFEVIQEKNSSFALVLNEFGGVEGMITARDVLNFIFNDLTDHVLNPDEYRVEGKHGTYEVPGEMRLNDFDDITNFGLDDPRMTTIGGVAFRHFDRVPDVGDQVHVDGVTIAVLEVIDQRISKVRVTKGIVEPDADTTDAPMQMEDQS